MNVMNTSKHPKMLMRKFQNVEGSQYTEKMNNKYNISKWKIFQANEKKENWKKFSLIKKGFFAFSSEND
jgi:hypothetical protein